MHINIILVGCLIWFDATAGLQARTSSLQESRTDRPSRVVDFNLNKVSRQDEWSISIEQSFPSRDSGRLRLRKYTEVP
jgi:hypothetical protein